MKTLKLAGSCCLLSFAMTSAPAVAETAPKDLVDALNGIFGQHAGRRASHA